MRGYVTIDKPELKVREYDLYTAYYCGVCKSIGRRYSQVPRLALTYDAAFMAALFGSIGSEGKEVKRFRCPVHPSVERAFCSGEAVDYAADMMLILAYGKLDDDVRDEGSLPAAILKGLCSGTYRKLKSAYPEITSVMEEELKQLSALEKEESGSLDDTAETFGRIMEAVFGGFTEGRNGFVLGRLGFHLGRWLYLIDAFDDLEEDIKGGRPNPLVYRFKYNKEENNPDSFRDEISEHMEILLYDALGQVSMAVDLLEINKNEGLIKNIVLLGMRKKTDEVLKNKIN